MRILLLFLLFMSSFVFAQECSISFCQESTGLSCILKDNSIYSITGNNVYDIEASEEKARLVCLKEGITPTGFKFNNSVHEIRGYQENNSSQKLCLSVPVVWKKEENLFCSIDNPTLPEFKKCTEAFCSGADKRRWENASWYETGTGCTSQNVKFRFISGGSEMSIDFTCENPKKSSGPICIRYYDEPTDCSDDDSEEEAPSIPDSVDVPDIDKVPCFGNVEDCNSTSLPDYVDPNTGVPCWGKECGNVSPPDSVGPDGTPCWGDKCGISPPTGSGDGSGSGNGDGSTGGGSGSGNGDGSTGGGSGSGNGDGSTGDGSGSEEGNGEDWGNCPPGGCPDNSGLINGKGFAKVPDTFHETKYRDKAIEEALDKYIKENPFDFGSIDTDLGVNGACPVNWSIPFLHGTSINFGVPCSVFDQLRTFFIFLSYLFGFYHIFRKRG